MKGCDSNLHQVLLTKSRWDYIGHSFYANIIIFFVFCNWAQFLYQAPTWPKGRNLLLDNSGQFSHIDAYLVQCFVEITTKDWLLWQRDVISSVTTSDHVGICPSIILFLDVLNIWAVGNHCKAGALIWVLSFGSCIILAMWKGGIGFFLQWTGGDGNLSAQLHFSMGSQLPGGYREML